MKRSVYEELAARIRLDFPFFHIPFDLIEHAGVSTCLSHARPLWSQDGVVWMCTSGALLETNLHPSVVRLGQGRSDPACRIRWRCQASRGGAERLQVNDAVCVRAACGGPAVSYVSDACAARDGTIRHFQVVVFFTTRAGTPSAVVHPFTSMGGRRYRTDRDRFSYLALSPGVRRALALHDCQCSCEISATALSHTATNV